MDGGDEKAICFDGKLMTTPEISDDEGEYLFTPSKMKTEYIKDERTLLAILLAQTCGQELLSFADIQKADPETRDVFLTWLESETIGNSRYHIISSKNRTISVDTMFQRLEHENKLLDLRSRRLIDRK
jgi:hypothetical protein